MVIDPKVRQNRIKQMTHLYELITKDNEKDKEILYKTLSSKFNIFYFRKYSIFNFNRN